MEIAHIKSRAVATLLISSCLMVAGLSASPALADDGQQQQDIDDPVVQQLRSLQREIENLRGENRQMRLEVDQLRAQSNSQWMTERRAEEVRQIVHDVLADADVRSNLLDSGITAGWNEHFFLSSVDNRFFLQLDGLIQTRFVLSRRDFPDRVRSGFEVTRSKLTLRGHVFDPTLTYLVRTQFTREEPGLVPGLAFLQDAWVRKQFNDTFSIRAGQFKLPFNREELVAPQYQLAVERTAVNQGLNIGRSQGIEFRWAWEYDQFAFVVSDGGHDRLGGFNATIAGENPVNSPALVEDVEWAFTGRYERLLAGSWRQFQDFTSPVHDEFGLLWGIAGHAQKDEANNVPSGFQNERQWFALTSDLSAEWGGASAFVSVIYHYTDAAQVVSILEFFGVTAQAAVYVTPKLELFARGELGHLSTDFENPQLSFEDLNWVTLGANYYIDGHDVKWTTDLGFGLNEVGHFWNDDLAGLRVGGPDSSPQIVFRTQIQIAF